MPPDLGWLLQFERYFVLPGGSRYALLRDKSLRNKGFLRVLLVEPEYRAGSKKHVSERAGNPARRDDETLWYPPLGLMKISTFHKNRGDEVEFVIGTNKKIHQDGLSFDRLWDRVYISSLFTFDWKDLISTVEYFKDAVGGSTHKILIGGVMASILPEEIFEETGIYPVTGILYSPQQIGLEGDENIDLLPPDYDLVDKRLYAINDTYYAYTTRGCINRCDWCGVPSIEPDFIPYIDIKPMIETMRKRYGDKAKIKLMDNNVLASPHLERIVDDLFKLGYGREMYTTNNPRKLRVIDFNQGLDASHMNESTLETLWRLNIRPMRVAFDQIGEMVQYEKALRLAHKQGFREFSNYMLYNCNDTPRDLYDRLQVNFRLNDEWRAEDGKYAAAIYSYPMRFAPIKDPTVRKANRSRDYDSEPAGNNYDHLQDARWNRKFVRNIEIMKGAANGAISPTTSLARRAIGETYETFIVNLYMPEEMIRHRNKYEKAHGGDGSLEKFREFTLGLLRKQDSRFQLFHTAVSQNTRKAVKQVLEVCTDPKLKEWLGWYLQR